MADPTTGTPILRTKLHRPPVPADLVPRVDLLQQLEQNRQRPLTIVCAPLCDAIGVSNEELEPGEISGWEFVARLKKENVFVIPLDTDNRWFRYHHRKGSSDSR